MGLHREELFAGLRIPHFRLITHGGETLAVRRKNNALTRFLELEGKLHLAGLGIEPAAVGLAGAWSSVESAAARPPKAKGTIVTDEGNGGTAIAEFLSAQKFI